MRKKLNQILKKHEVSFEEAATVFDDSQCLILDDPAHSIDEFRFLVLGYSIAHLHATVLMMSYGVEQVIGDGIDRYNFGKHFSSLQA